MEPKDGEISYEQLKAKLEIAVEMRKFCADRLNRINTKLGWAELEKAEYKAKYEKARIASIACFIVGGLVGAAVALAVAIP